jgi:hypothetical protein
MLAPMETPKTGTAVAAALALVIAGGVGYGIHKAVKQRAEERAVVSIVTETTEQLRDVLRTSSPEVAGKIDGNLRVARSWSNVYMADAAEHYLIGAREIARKRADAARNARKFAASRAALAAHMNRAGGRDTSWIRTASQLKKQMEQDHFDLETSLGALADLLQSLPEAQKRLEPYVAASLTLDDGLRAKARQQALEEAKRANADLERARSLAPRF